MWSRQLDNKFVMLLHLWMFGVHSIVRIRDDLALGMVDWQCFVNFFQPLGTSGISQILCSVRYIYSED